MSERQTVSGVLRTRCIEAVKCDDNLFHIEINKASTSRLSAFQSLSLFNFRSACSARVCSIASASPFKSRCFFVFCSTSICSNASLSPCNRSLYSNSDLLALLVFALMFPDPTPGLVLTALVYPIMHPFIHLFLFLELSTR